MGAGIAHAFLVAGCTVALVDVSPAAADAARSRVARAVARSVERGSVAEPAEGVLARLTVSSSTAAVEGSSLVVEAVPEDPALKSGVLADVERAVDGAALLATNTSSISVGELSRALARPERFVGLHFFNPVPASAMVEVVVGPETADEVVARAHGVVAGIGKEAVVVHDSPGFASSRLGVLVGLEAVRMLEEGVATAEDIDRAMILGYRHPVGPLHLTDLVGLDVRLGIADYLHRTLGPRFEPPALLRDKVAAGDLGRKAGRGFFEYPEG